MDNKESTDEDQHTTIQISRNLAKSLKSIKITKFETYEEIIQRILDFYNDFFIKPNEKKDN